MIAVQESSVLILFVQCVRLVEAGRFYFSVIGHFDRNRNFIQRHFVGLRSPKRRLREQRAVERIGALIELPPVYENLSAVDNLKVRTWTLGISDARILEVLDIVDLKNTGKKQVGKFSMGMKQRLGIAVALLNDPDFLILDEPANGLDPFGIRQLREMLVSFAESGMTVLVSSHILGEIQQTADYIGILANGVLGYQGGQQENLEELFTEIVSRNRG